MTAFFKVSQHNASVYWFREGSVVEGVTVSEGWYYWNAKGDAVGGPYQTEQEALSAWARYWVGDEQQTLKPTKVQMSASKWFYGMLITRLIWVLLALYGIWVATKFLLKTIPGE